MMAKCTECGSSHKSQQQKYATGTVVRSTASISNHEHGQIPIGAVGKITGHCDDGRAIIFFDHYPQASHTFHYINDFVQPLNPKG